MAHEPDSPIGVQTGVPCSLYRGGTSRGVLLRGRDLPPERAAIEPILQRIFGSPDVRQIDGVGGGSSQTSKAMIVERAAEPGADVQMTFAQVSVDTEKVDWGGNCGNMTAAVGPFAIEAGLVTAVEPITIVRIVSSNTGLRVAAHVPVRNGAVVTEGDYQIPGVPGRGAEIVLEWFEPGGSVTGRLLPTGHASDVLRLSDGRSIEVSIVDAANPVVFCQAQALGLTGAELPDDLRALPDAMATLEELRSRAAELIEIVPSWEMATQGSPGIPKVAFVAPPAAYQTSAGLDLDAGGHDIQARLMSMQAPHRSYAVSGGICTATAASIDGTTVRACARRVEGGPGPFRIAHPCGVMQVRLDLGRKLGDLHVRSARVGTTARRIMSGLAYVPASLLRHTPQLAAPGLKALRGGAPTGDRAAAKDPN